MVLVPRPSRVLVLALSLTLAVPFAVADAGLVLKINRPPPQKCNGTTVILLVVVKGDDDTWSRGAVWCSDDPTTATPSVADCKATVGQDGNKCQVTVTLPNNGKPLLCAKQSSSTPPPDQTAVGCAAS